MASLMFYATRLEMDKVEYNDLVSNCIILKNVVDMTQALLQMQAEGYPVNSQTIAHLSPYLTEHIRRFGTYWFEPDKIEIAPFDFELPVDDTDYLETSELGEEV